MALESLKWLIWGFTIVTQKHGTAVEYRTKAIRFELKEGVSLVNIETCSYRIKSKCQTGKILGV